MDFLEGEDEPMLTLPGSQEEDLYGYFEEKYGKDDDNMDDIKRIFIEERGEMEWSYQFTEAMKRIRNFFEMTKERQE